MRRGRRRWPSACHSISDAEQRALARTSSGAWTRARGPKSVFRRLAAGRAAEGRQPGASRAGCGPPAPRARERDAPGRRLSRSTGELCVCLSSCGSRPRHVLPAARAPPLTRRTGARHARSAPLIHSCAPCPPRRRTSSAWCVLDSSRSRVSWTRPDETPFRDRNCAGSDAANRTRFYFALCRDDFSRSRCSCVGVKHCAAKGGCVRAPHARPQRAA